MSPMVTKRQYRRTCSRPSSERQTHQSQLPLTCVIVSIKRAFRFELETLRILYTTLMGIRTAQVSSAAQMKTV